jgi:hypothetical protein
MSKLLDRLDQITRGPVRTLGFTPAAVRETVPTMALLAWVNDVAKADLSALAKAGVDALILAESGQADGKPKPPEGSTWGVAVGQLDRQQVDSRGDTGCDFLVFGIENTSVDALDEGECSRVLRIPSDLEDTLLRSVEDLPVDIVLLNKPGPDGPLSLSHLMAISNVRASTSRYLLLEWEGELTEKELGHLRDLGVDGIVINVANSLASTVATMRERVDQMPARKPRSDREQRGAAVLPRLGGVSEGRHRHDDEDDDDEEWDEP